MACLVAPLQRPDTTCRAVILDDRKTCVDVGLYYSHWVTVSHGYNYVSLDASAEYLRESVNVG